MNFRLPAPAVIFAGFGQPEVDDGGGGDGQGHEEGVHGADVGELGVEEATEEGCGGQEEDGEGGQAAVESRAEHEPNEVVHPLAGTVVFTAKHKNQIQSGPVMPSNRVRTPRPGNPRVPSPCPRLGPLPRSASREPPTTTSSACGPSPPLTRVGGIREINTRPFGRSVNLPRYWFGSPFSNNLAPTF